MTLNEAEKDDPLKGMQQAKGYADCKRLHVQYVFATNGHLYGEFDKIKQLPDGPHPFLRNYCQMPSTAQAHEFTILRNRS